MYYIFIWIYKITQTNQVNFTVFLDISFFVTEYFTVWREFGFCSLLSCWFVAWVVKAGFNLESKVTKWMWTTRNQPIAAFIQQKINWSEKIMSCTPTVWDQDKKRHPNELSLTNIQKMSVSEGKIPSSKSKYSVVFLWRFMRHAHKLFQNGCFLYLCID